MEMQGKKQKVVRITDPPHEELKQGERQLATWF